MVPSMRLGELALAVTFALVVASAIAAAQPGSSLVIEGPVEDAAYSGGLLYVGFGNGTLAVLDGARRAWGIDLRARGTPKIVESAGDDSAVVLTDSSQLGLIMGNGSARWIKLPLDPNAVARGKSGLACAGESTLAYAGGMAVLVRLPELEAAESFSVLNTFLSGRLGPGGSGLLLVGFDTFCPACIMSEEKRVILVGPGETLGFIASRLRDAAVLWRLNWLALAHWDSLKVYKLAARALGELVREVRYERPAKEWLSYGFAPSGSVFHYVYSEGGLLRVTLIDVESGEPIVGVLSAAGCSRVISAVGDDRSVALVCYDSYSGVARALYGKLQGELRIADVTLGPPRRLKLGRDGALFIFERGLLAMPTATSPRAEQEKAPPLARLTVKVLDDGGRPVYGALVCVNSSCALTSTTGDASLTLARGSYVLKVSAPGTEGHVEPLSIQGDTTVLVSLRRYYALRVVVVGRFEDGCAVVVRSAGGGEVGRASACNATFEVPRGTYTVAALLGGQAVEQQAAVNGDALVVLALPQASHIAVLVSNGSGVLEGATIELLDARNATVSRSSGSLKASVPPGAYTVSVRVPGYANLSARLELRGGASLTILVPPRRESEGQAGGYGHPAVTAAASASAFALGALAARYGALGGLARLLGSLKRRMAAPFGPWMHAKRRSR